MKLILKFLFLFIFLINYSSAQVTVQIDSLFSSSLNTISKYTLILPNGYYKNQERFPVLYLLHGLGGNHTNWVTLTKLTTYAAAYRIIIVCPDGSNGWYSNSPFIPNARYEDHLIKDIIPAVEMKYRTIRTRYYRGIAGLSMGGYGALKMALKHPEMFIFAAGLSPSIQFPGGLLDSVIVARWSRTATINLRELFGDRRTAEWDAEDLFLLTEKAQPSTMPYLYLSAGSQDGIVEIPELTHTLASALRTRKIPFEMHEMPGGHDWKFWDSEIQTVLRCFTARIGKR